MFIDVNWKEKACSTMRFGKKVSAYFTVEAALLLPLISALLFMMTFFAFFSYDRCILEQAAYEAAVRGSTQYLESNEETYEVVKETATKLITDRLFAIDQISCTVSVSAKVVSVRYQCSFQMPFGAWIKDVIEDAWDDSIFTIDVLREVPRKSPVERIRGNLLEIIQS